MKKRISSKNLVVATLLVLVIAANVSLVWAATYPENFDTDGNWTNVTGATLAAYGTKEYDEASHPEVEFMCEVGLRQTPATQDGVEATRGGTGYAWRLRDEVGSLWQAKITSRGVGTFSIWVRRWDGNPSPDYVAEYSTDNGGTWTTVQSIDNTWLDSSSNWKQVSGTIDTPNGTGDADDIVIRIRRVGGERLMVDDFEMEDHPTAVDLLSFTATPRRAAIVLRWETATEIDNLGFHLYRAESQEGERTRLNASLIPTRNPGSPVGAVYTWQDTSAQPGVTYYYWLEDVDIYGVATPHGPESATMKPRQRPGPAAVPAPGLAPAHP